MVTQLQIHSIHNGSAQPHRLGAAVFHGAVCAYAVWAATAPAPCQRQGGATTLGILIVRDDAGLVPCAGFEDYGTESAVAQVVLAAGLVRFADLGSHSNGVTLQPLGLPSQQCSVRKPMSSLIWSYWAW